MSAVSSRTARTHEVADDETEDEDEQTDRHADDHRQTAAHRHTSTTHTVYSRHIFTGGGNPPKKTLTIPPSTQTDGKLCALNLFFSRNNELPIYHGNFLLTDNKHRKLFVIKQSKGCKLMTEMHQTTFGGRAPPGPAEGAYALPQTS